GLARCYTTHIGTPTCGRRARHVPWEARVLYRRIPPARLIMPLLLLLAVAAAPGGSTHAVGAPAGGLARPGWRRVQPMARGVDSAAATGGGTIYVLGGCLDGYCKHVSSATQIYTPDSATWTVGAPLPWPRRALVAAVS